MLTHEWHHENWILRVGTPKFGLVLKMMTSPLEGRLETLGYEALKAQLPIPPRYAVITIGSRTFLIYRLVPTLLTDMLAIGQPSEIASVSDILVSAYRTAVTRTLAGRPRQRLNTKLSVDRVRPGGRLDAYYGVRPKAFSNIIEPARRLLREEFLLQNRLVPSAFLQGDPTETNIGFPLCLLDYDTVGYTELTVEFAVFLWGVMYLNGSLAPRLRSAERTLPGSALKWAATAFPRWSGGRWRVPVNDSRMILLNRYVESLVEPRLLDPDDQRSFVIALLLRVLVVYNVGTLDRPDQAFLLQVADDLIVLARGQTRTPGEIIASLLQRNFYYASNSWE